MTDQRSESSTREPDSIFNIQDSKCRRSQIPDSRFKIPAECRTRSEIRDLYFLRVGSRVLIVCVGLRGSAWVGGKYLFSRRRAQTKTFFLAADRRGRTRTRDQRAEIRIKHPGTGFKIQDSRFKMPAEPDSRFKIPAECRTRSEIRDLYFLRVGSRVLIVCVGLRGSAAKIFSRGRAQTKTFF